MGRDISKFLHTGRRALLGLIIALSAGLPFAASAAAPAVLVETGGAAPNSTTFSTFGLPSINDGQVTYWGVTTTGTSTNYIFDTTLTGSTVAIVHTGDPAPGGEEYSATDLASNPPEINPAGQIGLSSVTVLNQNNWINALYVSGGSPRTVTRSVAIGQAAPDGNGTFSNIPSILAMNSTAQFAFEGTLTGTTHGSTDDLGIFRVTQGGSPLTQIARYGATVPGGSGTFGGTHVGNTAFFQPYLNDSGLVTFVASIAGTTRTDDSAVYTGNGTTTTQISRVGDPITHLGATGTITEFTSESAINNAGQTAFIAGFEQSNGVNGGAIYRAAPAGGLTEIAYAGEYLPGSTTAFIYNLPQAVALNNAGEVAAFIQTNTVSNSNLNALIRGSGSGTFTLVVRNGQSTGRGDGGVFDVDAFDSQAFAMNDSGNIAFSAILDQGGTTIRGLFFYSDATGLQEIIQGKDTFGGSTVSSVGLAGTGGFANSDANGIGLDAANHVTFHFTLANGNTGIAVWNGPSATPTADTPVLPPWALVLLAAMLLSYGALTTRRRPV